MTPLFIKKKSRWDFFPNPNVPPPGYSTDSYEIVAVLGQTFIGL